MMSETDSENVELEAGQSEDQIRSDDRQRPDDSERLEIIRLMGQLGAGDQILWNDRKQPLTVVRRVSPDDLRGQCLNLRRLGRQWAARVINGKNFDGDKDEIKDLVGDVTLTGEFGDEFLLVRGPRGGLYRMTIAYSSKRGRHLPVFQSRVRARTHASGKFRSNDAWDANGTEVRRLARVGHDGDVDPDAVDPDDSAAFVNIDELSGRSLINFSEDGRSKEYTFTDADVDAGVVPPEVSEYADTMYASEDEAETGTYNVSSSVTLDLSEFASADPEDLPGRFNADTFLSIARGEDGGLAVSEVPERDHHQKMSDDGAYIAEIHDGEHMRTAKVTFGSSYPVFVENGGKDAVKNAPSAAYDSDYQRWTVDGEDALTAIDSLLDVEGVDTITAPPKALKYLAE